MDNPAYNPSYNPAFNPGYNPAYPPNYNGNTALPTDAPPAYGSMFNHQGQAQTVVSGTQQYMPKQPFGIQIIEKRNIDQVQHIILQQAQTGISMGVRQLGPYLHNELRRIFMSDKWHAISGGGAMRLPRKLRNRQRQYGYYISTLFNEISIDIYRTCQ